MTHKKVINLDFDSESASVKSRLRKFALHANVNPEEIGVLTMVLLFVFGRYVKQPFCMVWLLQHITNTHKFDTRRLKM